MKYRILTNNGVHIDEIETYLSLSQIHARLLRGEWLLIDNRIINPRIIDQIVEMPEPEE